MVEETVDLDELANHNYVLVPSFDATLEKTRDKLIEVMDGLDREHENVANDLGLDQEKKLHLEKHQVYGYSLRVTKAVSCILQVDRSTPGPRYVAAKRLLRCLCCFRIIQEVSKMKNKSGYIELATQKSGTIFTTRKLRSLSEEHTELTQLYEKQQRSLVKEVVGIACQLSHSEPNDNLCSHL